MMVHRFDRARLKATPWKNGGGLTHEIVRQPATSELDDFDWRASIATITASGPFSPFAETSRIIVLLDGAPVRLRSEDGRIDHSLETLVPFAFDGAAPLVCTAGPASSSDFNLMARRGAWRIDAQVVRRAQALPASSSGVLFAVHGAWEVSDADMPVRDGGRERLEPNTGLWWHDHACAWTLTPVDVTAALVAVRLWPRRDRVTS